MWSFEIRYSGHTTSKVDDIYNIILYFPESQKGTKVKGGENKVANPTGRNKNQVTTTV